MLLHSTSKMVGVPQAVLVPRSFLHLLAHVKFTPVPGFQKSRSHLICKSIILVPLIHQYFNSILSTVYQPEVQHFKTLYFVCPAKADYLKKCNSQSSSLSESSSIYKSTGNFLY